MKCDKKTMLLYAVTDRMWVGKATLTQQVESALKGGITCVQLREKSLDDEKFLDEAKEIKELCEKYRVPFIVNDSVEIAIKCNADGLHIGQNDMMVCEARRLIGESMMLGVSAQTVTQAIMAEKDGADYIGVGAVFQTSTKTDAEFVSYNTLKEICKSVTIPVVAIGGINKENILELSDSGIDGVALVSAIFAAKDIESECRELRVLSERMVNK